MRRRVQYGSVGGGGGLRCVIKAGVLWKLRLKYNPKTKNQNAKCWTCEEKVLEWISLAGWMVLRGNSRGKLSNQSSTPKYGVQYHWT